MKQKYPIHYIGKDIEKYKNMQSVKYDIIQKQKAKQKNYKDSITEYSS